MIVFRFSQILSEIGSKDRSRMTFIIIFISLFAIAAGSVYFLGPNNAVEEEAEHEMEEMIHLKIELPEETVHGVYIPAQPDNKSKIDNS
jgi:hypothetical protein